MPVNNNYRNPSRIITISYDFLKELSEIVKNAMDGKTNNTGEVKLTAGDTTTIVKNILCNPNSVVTLSAKTTDAAALAGVFAVEGNKEFIIAHPSDPSEDLVFRYVITG